MSHVRRFDHVGLTVADLDVVTAFFVALVQSLGRGGPVVPCCWRVTTTPRPAHCRFLGPAHRRRTHLRHPQTPPSKTPPPPASAAAGAP
jgi:hypothetical protein